MEPAVQQTIEILAAAKPIFSGGAATAYVGVAGTLVGAIAGGLGAHWNQRVMARRGRDEESKSVAFQLYAEMQSIREIEVQRGYISGLREVVAAFKAGQTKEWSYTVQLKDDPFPIFKANIQRLGLLPPAVQTRIVLFYQLLDAVMLDMKPGGLMNAKPAGEEVFTENLRLAEKAKSLCDEAIARIEALYPDVEV